MFVNYMYVRTVDVGVVMGVCKKIVNKSNRVCALYKTLKTTIPRDSTNFNKRISTIMETLQE